MYRRCNMPPPFPENDDVHPRTVQEIYGDYCLRRLGFIRAFSIDVDSFYSACDPEMERLCAYAYPNGSWDATPRADLPPGLPKPRDGINLARRRFPRRQDWLSLVASISDSWLQSLAFFFSAHLTIEDRNKLFVMINGFPTLEKEVRRLYSV